ncbi:MAG: threonine synthase [Candidatus Abyssobacteria bacterium SURF_5]|uniref:Threonine synthase n=1 Tax=Abyssobacteria bacterium (strain SURF_5) TaxID=2093360 RepID=A0A3A4NEP1_ABYX5|nr:MAG: threonine synthase [Candidatus Abyssubacteria bacterium SURF_5]
MKKRANRPAEKFSLKCPACSAQYSPGTFTCDRCHAPTVVSINLERLPAPQFLQPELPAPFSQSLWKYFELLPLNDPQWIVSQGEGLTPLINSSRLAKTIGIRILLLKNETVNPTGSFKDRQITLSVSKMHEAGARTVAVVSSGNVAASAASYSAIAGIRCFVFAPSNAPDEKLVQARMYGAVFHKVNTLSSSRIFKLVLKCSERKGWRLLSTTGLYNPYQVEGAKTIAYELVEQAELPDWIIAPVGGGGLLGALWRGFSELKELGLCRRVPRLVGVQSSACTPLVNALSRNLSPAETIASPVEVKPTIAGAIADDVLFDAYTAIPAVRLSGGIALSVTDEQMLQAEKLLAQEAGVFAEPASAATVAALKQLRDSGTVDQADSVCCIVTGSGFKDMASAKKMVSAPPVIEAAEDAFLELE